MQELDTIRHDAYFDYRTYFETITIIGVGGVGSRTVEQLVNLGCGKIAPLVAYDHDIVEPHNTPNQTYDPCDAEEKLPKVVALTRQTLRWGGGTKLVTHHKRFENEKLSGVVVLCVDDMEERLRIVETSIEGCKDISLMIEVRIDATYILIYTIDPKDPVHVAEWKANWFPSSKAENTAGCSGPVSMGYTATIAGCLITKLFTDYVAKNRVPNLLRFDLTSWKADAFYW